MGKWGDLMGLSNGEDGGWRVGSGGGCLIVAIGCMRNNGVDVNHSSGGRSLMGVGSV